MNVSNEQDENYQFSLIQDDESTNDNIINVLLHLEIK